jgi:cation:H+ antiporter
MDALVAIALLAAAVLLVVRGAELFFDGLLAAASRLGISAFTVTVVVSGFELENLAAGIAADLKGLPDAAAGTFLGGTTFLALAVAGLAALVAPIRGGIPRRALLWVALSPLPLLALALDGHLGRVEGLVLALWSGLVLWAIVRAGRVLPPEAPHPRARFPLLRVLAGLGVLTAGGELLGEGIRRTVSDVGISQALLGNTAVAAAVEAEEVARVVTPARRGRGELALANVLGTIPHFCAFNAGLIALVRPLELGHASTSLHLPVAAAAPALLAVVVALRGGLGRSEGVLLVAAYAAYVIAAIVAA